MYQWIRLFPDFSTVLFTEAEGPDSFFRAVLEGFYTVYQREQLADGTPIRKDQLVAGFRQDLANELYAVAKGLTTYEILAEGKIREYALQQPELWSIEALANALRRGDPPGYGILELTADVAQTDIYCVDAATGDVLATGYERFYQKGRPAVVLYVTRSIGAPEHYDLLGVFDGQRVVTYFLSDNPFILFLKDRTKHLLNPTQSF